MTPMRKLTVVVAVQLFVLLSVLGFGQYTAWTGETVLLKVQPVDPQSLLRGDYIRVRYDISRLDMDELPGDDDFCCAVYVELRENEDGYWKAVAAHERRDHSFDGTVLLKGHFSEVSPAGVRVVEVVYGIEEIFIPEGSGDQLPSGTDHTIAVEVKVNRFGYAIPRRFFVDGEPFELERR
jgi:uncharacterized membrane-anchored protein